MENINELEVYNNGMRKSLMDKAFFISKLPIHIDTILDFGCADASLIKFLAQTFPSMKFFGYDFDEVMREKAKENTKDLKNVTILNCSNLQQLKRDRIFLSLKNVALNLSSVIHEVYNYTVDEVPLFWDFVKDSGFDAIVIRDLCIDHYTCRPSNKHDILKIRSFANKKHLQDFESTYGSISSNENLIHFLMKYRYIENWNRECHENYFPLFLEEFLSLIGSEYKLFFFDHYILPFLKEKILEDFDITLTDSTHVKFIFTK